MFLYFVDNQYITRLSLDLTQMVKLAQSGNTFLFNLFNCLLNNKKNIGNNCNIENISIFVIVNSKLLRYGYSSKTGSG